MNSTWFHCPECHARWFFQFKSGEVPLRRCTACGSDLVEYVDRGPSGSAGGGRIDPDRDPDREAIAMIRKAFGPDVEELDPSEDWTTARELAGTRG